MGYFTFIDPQDYLQELSLSLVVRALAHILTDKGKGGPRFLIKAGGLLATIS